MHQRYLACRLDADAAGLACVLTGFPGTHHQKFVHQPLSGGPGPKAVRRRRGAAQRALRLRARPGQLLSELDECVPDNATQLQLEQRIISEIITHWLDSLDREERILFVRRYWYADTVKELAAEQGMTANQMARRMQRLRESLRLTLEKEGVEI